MNQAMLQVVQGVERLYPHKLEQQFPRIAEKIIQIWETPQVEAFLTDLLVTGRPGRQGFPPEVAKEIYYLSQIRERTRPQAPSGNVWDVEVVQQRVIESAGYECSPQGFLHAAEAGDRKIVGAFLSGGAKIDITDERGWTPLMISSFNGNEEIAQLLIASGANIRIKDKSGYGPMHWAAFNGYTDVVKLLITKLADVNAQSHHGWTPLLQAATRGHAAACASLIEGSANVNVQSNDGWTALHKACANGHVEVVKLLLAAKANRDIQHEGGATPLSLATKNNHVAIVALLQST
jgi:hypothetical protein